MEVNINNINTVSEVDMVCFTSESNQITSSLLIFIPKIKKKKKDYTMDIFFRQYWTDKRLSFEGITELVIGADVLKQIWVPDTFIGNYINKSKSFHL